MLIFLASFAAFAPGVAFAQSCSLSLSNVVFGAVDVSSGSPVDTTATATVTCSAFAGGGGRLCVSIDVGPAGDATSRMMQSGANTLRYNLYTTAARTTVWGSWETGYAGPGVEIDVSNGTSNLTVYARLLGSQQSASAGSYAANFATQPFLRYRNVAASTSCPTSGYQTTTGSFVVTATVVPVCTVAAASLNFGSVGLLTSNVDGTATVSVTCTNSAPYNVGLGVGNGTGATIAARKMTNAGATITYSLYSNAARTTVWGNTPPTNTVNGTGTGSAQNLTVYGRVPA